MAGVKAVETAVRVLVALTGAEQPQMLTDIARRARMHPAKVHRYLASFIKQGIVSKDEDSGLYIWGPLALDIGAAAFRSVSFIRIAADEAARLRDQLGATVAIAVWGTYGATHVVVEEARKSVVTKSQLGSVLPLLTSATGRVFAAYLPSTATQDLLEAEYKELKKKFGAKVRSRTEFNHIIKHVRTQGISQVLGDYSPGIHALSSPVFDHKDAIVGALTVLAPAGDFDASETGASAAMLQKVTEKISQDLGRRR